MNNEKTALAALKHARDNIKLSAQRLEAATSAMKRDETIADQLLFNIRADRDRMAELFGEAEIK